MQGVMVCKSDIYNDYLGRFGMEILSYWNNRKDSFNVKGPTTIRSFKEANRGVNQPCLDGRHHSGLEKNIKKCDTITVHPTKER